MCKSVFLSQLTFVKTPAVIITSVITDGEARSLPIVEINVAMQNFFNIIPCTM